MAMRMPKSGDGFEGKKGMHDKPTQITRETWITEGYDGSVMIRAVQWSRMMAMVIILMTWDMLTKICVRVDTEIL